MNESNIRGLLKLWEERMIEANEIDPSYADAVRDCIFELKQLTGVCNQEEDETKNPMPVTWY